MSNKIYNNNKRFYNYEDDFIFIFYDLLSNI